TPAFGRKTVNICDIEICINGRGHELLAPGVLAERYIGGQVLSRPVSFSSVQGDGMTLKRSVAIGLLGALVAFAPASAYAGAVLPNAGFTANTLAPNDDGSTGLVSVGFTLNF